MPHATTGQSAALLFLGHLICNRFDLLHHESERKVIWKQARHDAHPQFHKFAVGDTVMIHDARDKSQWRTGTVMEQRRLMSYQVQLQSNVIQHRHVDHLLEWVPARVTNAGPPVVMYQHWHLLHWLKPPVMFLMNNRSRSTPMPNHHTVHRRFCLMVPRRTPSQWRHIVAILRRVLPSQYVYSLTATCISCRAYSTPAQCRSRTSCLL